MVEEIGDRDPPVVQAGPVEIAEDGMRFRKRVDPVDERELLLGFCPCAAIEDQPIDPAPELAIERLPKCGLPPEAQGQVGIQMRKNNIRQSRSGLPVQAKRNLLGADLVFSFS